MQNLKADTLSMIKVLFIEDDLAYAKLVEVLLGRFRLDGL
jgi:hypothetical protein